MLINKSLAGRSTATSFGQVEFNENGENKSLTVDQQKHLGKLKGFEYIEDKKKETPKKEAETPKEEPKKEETKAQPKKQTTKKTQTKTQQKPKTQTKKEETKKTD